MASAPDNPLIPFQPVALRGRHDGWAARRQIAFIEALAETGIVDEACRRIEMSDTSAYALRRRSKRPAHLLGPQPPSLEKEQYEEDPAVTLDAELDDIAEHAPEEDGNPSTDWTDGQ